MPHLVTALRGVVPRALAGLVAVSATLFFSAGSTDASIVTFTVNDTADEPDLDPGDGACATTGGVCTLRAAIQESNALAGDNGIEVPAGTYHLTIPDDASSSDANGDLDIGDMVTITGAGSATTIIDGGDHDRIFELTGGLSAAISGLTIRNGTTPFGGGGISSGGELTLEDVVVSDNTAALDGGGINTASGSSLALTNSTIIGNIASRDGGGLLAATGSSLSITQSSISDNSGRLGGGILSRASGASVTETTIAGNSADDGGGGILNEGTMTLTRSTLAGNNSSTTGGGLTNVGTLTAINSTLSDNTATTSGGGVTNSGTLGLTNATIAENNATFGSSLDNSGSATLNNVILKRGTNGANCQGTFTSLGHNIANDDSCAGSLTETGDLSAQSPLLLPLADNGGHTQTHALDEGSPAIDGGDDTACPATDQRGVPRPQGAACDIGAFEVGEPLPPAPRQGDIDCDLTIAGNDALMLLVHVADQLTSIQGDGCPGIGTGDPPFGDVNCDGPINATDAVAILAYVAGATYGHQAGCTPIGQLLQD